TPKQTLIRTAVIIVLFVLVDVLFWWCFMDWPDWAWKALINLGIAYLVIHFVDYLFENIQP
ncbi:MAG: hypothetical protein K6G86_02680, partial [Bacteroidales bacterium]|nr:hypothetical protein [Bacteroidales bacterium]